MSLTDVLCRAVKPTNKINRLSDGDGLYLQIHPNGKKFWRCRYIYCGKENMQGLGSYPEVSLLAARKARDEIKRQITNGLNPNLSKKEAKELAQYANSQTLEQVVREWHAHYYDTWIEKTAYIILRRFELYVFPDLGAYPVGEITNQNLVSCLQKVEKKSRDVAIRLFKHLRKVFTYAKNTGRPNNSPTEGLEDILKKYKRGHHPAIDINRLPEFLKALHNNEGKMYRKTFLTTRLLMLTAVRTKELAHAEKIEFHIDLKQWVIPAKRMKMEQDHIVPLSRQAIKIIVELIEMSGKSQYLIPSYQSWKRPISRCTVLRALERIKFKGDMTGHGFRTVFLGVAQEKLGYPHSVGDRQLAHTRKGINGKAYDRANLLPQRTELMQKYADYLDTQLNPESQSFAGDQLFQYSVNKPHVHLSYQASPQYSQSVATQLEKPKQTDQQRSKHGKQPTYHAPKRIAATLNGFRYRTGIGD